MTSILTDLQSSPAKTGNEPRDYQSVHIWCSGAHHVADSKDDD